MALTDNLRACWEFNESSGNAADASGNGTTLTNNGTVGYSTGKLNKGAVMADGKYFTASDNSYVSLTGDATWAVWWYPTNLTNTNPYGVTGMFPFFDKWSYSTSSREYEIYAYNSSGTGTVGVNLSNNGSTTSSGSKSMGSISTNTWYHIVVVYDASAGSVEFYLNGSSLGAATGQVTSLKDGTATFGIGRFLNDNVASIIGTIDQAAIWARALSTTEVGELYNSGNGIEYPFSASSPTFRPHMMLI